MTFPLRASHRLTMKRDQVITTRVVHLLRLCRPSTITRLVMAVAVNTFDGVIALITIARRWAWTHVRVESLKRLSPAVADMNVSASVVLPLWILWITASLIDIQPRAIFRRAMRSAAAHAVRLFQLGRGFSAQTAAAPRLACAEDNRPDCGNRAAAASAAPPRIFAHTIGRIRHHRQAAKLLTTQVHDPWRICHKSVVYHQRFAGVVS